MTDEEILEKSRQLVTEWSESEGRGLALSILIAKAMRGVRDDGPPWWWYSGLGVSVGLTLGLALHMVMR